jgi:hypothetical protein
MVKEKKEKESAQATEALSIKSTTSIATEQQQQQQQQLSSSASTLSASSSTAVSIPLNQSTYMMSLYNTFFNQYMQNYAQQKVPKATAEVGDGEYESLTQQAAFYAQQQQSIQKQLETCLSSATQQFIKDLPTSSTTAAAATVPAPPSQVPTMQHNPYNMNYYSNIIS